jgi:hypothetical protein
MKPYGVAPGGLGLVHRRIGVFENIVLAGALAQEQNDANTRCATVLNGHLRAMLILGLKQVTLGQTPADFLCDGARLRL